MRRPDVNETLRILEAAGHTCLGDFGIQDRWAIRRPCTEATVPIKVNLYVIVEGCAALRNHLVVREELRRSADLRSAYGNLKMNLSQSESLQAYCEGKTDFIINVLKSRSDQFTIEELQQIDGANR